MSTEEERNAKENSESSQNGDVEQREQKLKYPRAIPFIISNEFCERFNYYGMRTILVLYMTRKLDFSDDTATILYHSFTTLVYFCCIIGAIIADSWWGKFHTILWLSIVYVVGSGVVALGAIETWNMPAVYMTIIGLVLVAFGSGGIKPCVAAFGGEQFTLPQQAKQLGIFFSLFYFAINLGSFVSTFVTPILRENVRCLGMTDCFPLGFGLPTMLMALSIVIFLAGKFLYRILPSQGNMFVKISRCIGNAVSTRSREKESNPRGHWLDYAESKYGKKLVMETKILMHVLVLYLPLPVFWALFDQQGSRWTLQATRMNGDFGSFTLKPDQVQVINPLLILVFIPLYEVIFYPVLNLVGIRRPLQKITLGGILAGVAFLCSMFVEIYLEKTYAVLPKPNEAQLRIFNGMNCQYTVESNVPTNFRSIVVEPNSYFVDLNIPIDQELKTYYYLLRSATPNCENSEGLFDLRPETATSYFITGLSTAPIMDFYDDHVQKSSKGTPLIRVLANLRNPQNIILRDKDGAQYNEITTERPLVDVPANIYQIFISDGTNEIEVVREGENFEFRLGGVYTIVIEERTPGNYFADIFIITDPNSMSMAWLVPQYVIMTLGEVMYSVTGLQFSYTQAPESMRSVLQGFWQLTVGVGNLIVTIIVGAQIFKSQTYEFALFAGLMFVDMALFAFLALRYKAIPLDELKKIDDEQKSLDDRYGEKNDPLDFPGTSQGDYDERKID